MNPGDHKTALQLAKRLIDAATVLTPEIPDQRSRQKTREKYIFDATKMIKKLVSQNYAEAMFFYADCFGCVGADFFDAAVAMDVDPEFGHQTVIGPEILAVTTPLFDEAAEVGQIR